MGRTDVPFFQARSFINGCYYGKLKKLRISRVLENFKDINLEFNTSKARSNSNE